MHEITKALRAVVEGNPGSADRLLDLVYVELRRLATAKMAREPAGHTLQPTALVHEAWLRLGNDAQPLWENRAHFFGAAAEAMRRVLVDHARRRRAQSRGGGQLHAVVDDLELASPMDDEQILAVDEVLTKLALVDPKKAELVKLRYFVGLSFEETAKTLGISEPTAKRWWAYARAWLHHQIKV